MLVFDLYTYETNPHDGKTTMINVPFSHNGCYHDLVPEPASIFLFGLGLLGLVSISVPALFYTSLMRHFVTDSFVA